DRITEVDRIRHIAGHRPIPMRDRHDAYEQEEHDRTAGDSGVPDERDARPRGTVSARLVLSRFCHAPVRSSLYRRPNSILLPAGSSCPQWDRPTTEAAVPDWRRRP